MLCPTLLVYPLLFPPLPWSTSGGLAACFTDVSSTQLLSCFSNGFLQQMIPCVYAPSFLLTPFLSIKTICCCLSDLERHHPIPQMLFFLDSGIGTHGQQAISPSCLFLMTNNVDVFFFQSYFPLLPLHTAFFFLFLLLCFLCTSGPYGISSSLTRAWRKKTSHTVLAPVTTGNMYANFFLCSGTEKKNKNQLYIFFIHTHTSKIKFTF